jgi:molybdenum cofactor cytidylyltransferase
MAGISAILTAAGESSRMGRPKALLPWHGVTLLEYQVRSLLDSGVSEVVVVLGYRADDAVPYAIGHGVRCVTNPDYRLGRSTSVRVGLGEIGPDAEGILLLAVDQPRSSEIVSAVVRAHRRTDALITSPRYRGRGGHPLIFSASLKGELEGISEEGQGVREVFQSHRDEVVELEIDDPLVRLDINTPEEYEEARERFGA